MTMGRTGHNEVEHRSSGIASARMTSVVCLPTDKARRWAIFYAACAVGVAVSSIGAVSFVGLLSPHASSPGHAMPGACPLPWWSVAC